METFKLQERSKEGKHGMAIVVGSGMLMATMDLLHTVSRFVEYKDIVTTQDIRKVVLYGIYADFIVVNAWFSVSKPQSLLYILSHFPSSKIHWYSNVDIPFGKKYCSLNELKTLNKFYENIEHDPKEKMV